MTKMRNKNDTAMALPMVILLVVTLALLFVPGCQASQSEFDVSKMDFTGATWIRQAVEQKVQLYKMDFPESFDFSFTPTSGTLDARYYCSADTGDVKKYYTGILKDAKDNGGNSVNIAGYAGDLAVTVLGKADEMGTMYTISITLDTNTLQYLRKMTDAGFPEQLLKGQAALAGLMGGELYGGYVLDNEDDSDESNIVGIPAYSRAYTYTGGQAGYNDVRKNAEAVLQDVNTSENGDLVYGTVGNYRLHLALTKNSSGAELSVVTVQKIK